MENDLQLLSPAELAAKQQDLAELEKLVKELEIRSIERDLRQYIPLAWPIIEPHRPFIHSWHIDAIADHLMACSEGHITKLVINIPPRHMKSITVSVLWPSWEWATRPETKWLFVSYARNLVVRDSVKTRRILQSDWYRGLWGNKFRLAGDQNVKSYYENDQGGSRIVGSIDSGITGEGGDRLVVDDPLKLEDTDNPDAITKVNEFWDGVLSSRINDAGTGVRVIIMQRLHENDLTGHVLREGGWTHLYLPTEYVPSKPCYTKVGRTVVNPETGDKVNVLQEFKDPRKVEGELLNPRRFGVDEIASIRVRLGAWRYAGQQQQNPIPAGGGLFKREWWQYYDVDSPQPSPIEYGGDAAMAWDCTFKDLTTSSYNVGLVGARKGAEIRLLYRVRKRLDLPGMLKAVVALKNMFPWVGPILVEDKANGTAVMQVLKKKLPGMLPRDPGLGGIDALASAVSYLVEAGNVLLPGKRDPNGNLVPAYAWVQELIAEAESFPRGEFKDQVAALSHLLKWFDERPVEGLSGMSLLHEGHGEPAHDQEGWIF